jgi:hypothetical protein
LPWGDIVFSITQMTVDDIVVERIFLGVGSYLIGGAHMSI